MAQHKGETVTQRFHRGVAFIAIGAAAAAAMGATTGHADRLTPVGASELPACVFEDGSGGPTPCYWDAEAQGNGRGDSYTVNADGSVTMADGSAGEPVRPPAKTEAEDTGPAELPTRVDAGGGGCQ